ncbi:autophagy-related protein 13a-like [Morus notabilis]|uniref:autophagy-related protein 13a-like n=1 Tax=Morus notabilis TaxID=981085 RepID=UPI000CED699E|nr:autophagy-related protein 13a-like [Morus notabilis]
MSKMLTSYNLYFVVCNGRWAMQLFIFSHRDGLNQNLPGKRAPDTTSQSLPMGRKSQDAAVGVLVHMLRTAPPLRQDSSCYSSNSLKAESEGGLATGSGFFMPRKASDALEELRSYREMKDLLLSKSGTRLTAKEEA